MRLLRPSATIAVCALVLATAAQAQCWTGGGPVALTLNGTSPSAADPVGHIISTQASATSYSIGLNGTPGTPFILLGAFSISCGATVIPGVAGSIDLASPFVLLNGIAPAAPFDFFAVSDFNLTLNLAPACSGPIATVAFQAVALDFTATPLPYALTEAGQVVRSAVSVTEYSSASTPTLFDDGSIAHALTCGGTMTFAGTSYTQLFVGSNGQVTFGNGSGDFSVTTAEFFDDFGTFVTTPNPGVAVLWADYNRSSVLNDSVRVTEDATAGTVQVEYLNQERWDSFTPCGNFSVTFGLLGADSLTLDYTGYITTGGAANDQSPIIGVSDGIGGAPGIDTTVDFSTSLGYTSAAGPESIMEQFPLGGSTLDLVATPLNFLHLGSYTWTYF
jgi:hypothetical protein